MRDQTTLNATAASLLGFLHEGSMTGWDLVAVAQQRIGNFWTLTQSQVYRELTAMAKAGLVTAGRPGPRDRKPYTITAKGRTAFRRWIDQQPGLEQIRFPLLLTIMFARHLPEERLAEMVATHRAVHEERLATYQRAAEQLGESSDADTGAPPAPITRTRRAGGAGGLPGRERQATLEFGLRYERAVLDWFEQLPTILGLGEEDSA